MKFTHRDTPQRGASRNDTEASKTSWTGQETTSDGINKATPADWNRLQKEFPSIERPAEKTGLEHWIESNVSKPSHYVREGGIECIDVMTSLFGEDRVREWAEITAFKYQWRQGTKAGNTAEQDKLKSIWYTRFSMGDDPRND